MLATAEYYECIVESNQTGTGETRKPDSCKHIQRNSSLSSIHHESSCNSRTANHHDVCENGGNMTFSKKSNKKDSLADSDQKPTTRIDFGEHFPDGGWGWIVTTAATVVYILCNGIHYSFGILYLCIQKRTDMKVNEVQTVWMGTVGLSVSLLMSPVISIICQRKSPRLYAVIGGLICSLGALFLAFSHKVEQLFISHCVVLSVGTGITLSAANIIVGRYFLRHRELAEMIVCCGTGVGAAVMAFVFHSLSGAVRWMKTLHCVVGILILTIIAGALYRSPSMYHPRRKMITQIKNQKKTRREQEESEPPYFDFSALRMRGLQALMIISSIAAFGIYVPFILLIKIGHDRHMPSGHLLLINVYMGLGFLVGVLAHGYIIIKDNKGCSICRRCLCQTNCIACGVLTLILVLEKDFDSFALYAWGFGIFCGGYFYSLKMYTYELVRVRIMERAWSFVCAAQVLPILVGSPISVYLNTTHQTSHAGFIFSGVAMVLAGFLFCLMPSFERHKSNVQVIQQAKNLCSRNSAEAAALLDLDLTDAMVTKPLNNVQFIVSPSRLKHTNKDGGKIQMQCFIHQKEKEKPKQIVLSKITEEKEGLRLDFNEVSHASISSKSNETSIACKNERDSKTGVSAQECPSDGVHSNHTGKSSSESNHSKAETKKLKKNIDSVKIELFDPPSQEKESTATVSYDSDLYINLCEAQV